MTSHPEPAFIRPGNLERRFWFLLVTVAVAIGVFYRFLGLSVWPLATDEYYIYRSIAFITESGLPEFPCGGYYTRGLLYQYAVAPLLALGLSPEASVRVVTIISNLAMLPAAYLLAWRIGGLRVAAVVLTILALSTWEIEISRFGRMYAPFQAIFVWYAYHAYCLIETGDRKRWYWLLGLSVAGPLVWEGGITVALLNFLPILMSRSAWRFGHLFAAVAILIASFAFLQTDFRTLGPQSAEPSVVESSAAQSAAPLDNITLFAPQLAESPVLAAVFAVLALIVMVGIVRILPAYRSSWRTIATLLSLIVCVLINQLLLAVMLLLGASLVGWFRLHEALSARYLSVFLPLAGMSVIWLVIALGVPTGDIPAGLRELIASVRPLIGFPELIDSFLYPWLLSLPLMATILLVGSGLALIFAVLRTNLDGPGLRLLGALLIVSFAVIGAAPIQYLETRYSFHVFPLLIILSIYGFCRLIVESYSARRALEIFVPPTVLCAFLFSSSFDLSHMVKRNTYDANFRVGYSAVRARHYYQRFDFKSPADFVNNNAEMSDTVITTSAVVTRYLDRDSYVYLHKTDERYRLQACDSGTMERWSGMPLLSDVEGVRGIAESRPASRVWLIVDHYATKSTLTHEYLTGRAGGYEQAFVSPDEKFRVYVRPKLSRSAP